MDNNLINQIGDLYGYAGIQTSYDGSEFGMSRYSPEVLKTAGELAPKIIEYRKKLKSMVDQIMSTDEARILIAMKGASAARAGGGYGEKPINQLFDFTGMNNKMDGEDKIDEAEGGEELSPVEQVIQQLVTMAGKGEISSIQIQNLNNELLKARKRFNYSNKSPEDKEKSRISGKVKKQLSQIDKETKDEVLKMLGIEKNTTPGNFNSPAFLLNMGIYDDKDIQKQYNNIYDKLFLQKVKENNIYNQEAINQYLNNSNINEFIDINRWIKLSGLDK
jgi:hypothetical protein